jgi:hypothetical protein
VDLPIPVKELFQRSPLVYVLVTTGKQVWGLLIPAVTGCSGQRYNRLVAEAVTGAAASSPFLIIT